MLDVVASTFEKEFDLHACSDEFFDHLPSFVLMAIYLLGWFWKKIGFGKTLTWIWNGEMSSLCVVVVWCLASIFVWWSERGWDNFLVPWYASLSAVLKKQIHKMRKTKRRLIIGVVSVLIVIFSCYQGEKEWSSRLIYIGCMSWLYITLVKKGRIKSPEQIRISGEIKELKKGKLELEKAAAEAAAEAEKAEKRVMKVFKDKDVNMTPDDLVEVDKTRDPVSMVFIGHVDAGKSTICGNLMYLNGIIDQRTIDKYKQEAVKSGRDSWWLAYVMDACDEEREKGKTVEVGRAQFDTQTKNYTIFDAPGHKNYVPNMIMGAALADVGGLVISARKGEFEAGFEAQGQTREHAQLAKSLGVQKLVVVVNKMDDCKWSRARFDEIKEKLTPFLNQTGYADKDLIWVPIAGLTGANIVAPLDGKTCNWY